MNRLNGFALLLFLALTVGGTCDCCAQSPQTPTWNELRSVVGASASSPNFNMFVAGHHLIKFTPMRGNAAELPPPLYLADGTMWTGFSIMVEIMNGAVLKIEILPGKGVIISKCMPVPVSEPATRQSILTALKPTPEAPYRDGPPGYSTYYNGALGFVIMFKGDAVDSIEFFPAEKATVK